MHTSQLVQRDVRTITARVIVIVLSSGPLIREITTGIWEQSGAVKPWRGPKLIFPGWQTLPSRQDGGGAPLSRHVRAKPHDKTDVKCLDVRENGAKNLQVPDGPSVDRHDAHSGENFPRGLCGARRRACLHDLESEN